VISRRAGPDDNAAILDFMREQHMQAGLSLRFDRSPSYFALLEAHSPDHRTWIATVAGRIVAVASVVVRPAYLDRSVQTVAYFADLRQAAGRKLAGLWRSLAQRVVSEVRSELGATLAFCSILRDNRLARASILESPLGSRLGLRHFFGYRTVSIVGRLPRFRGRRGEVQVRPATQGDDESLRQFVDSESRELQFAPVFDRRTWQRRIETWPDFGIDNFLMATDARGGIVGCLALWDSSSVNRIVVGALPWRAEVLRRAVNATAILTRRPRIPVGPESHLPDLCLTHLRIANRDPVVFAALLDAALRAMRRMRRHATLSLCLYDGDPLWQSLRHTIHSSVAMDLYWMPLDGAVAPPSNSALWPGFENYLV